MRLTDGPLALAHSVCIVSRVKLRIKAYKSSVAHQTLIKLVECDISSKGTQ